MKIDKKVLKKTTECKKNFVCLDNNSNILCKVVDSIKQEIHFVRCLTEIDCNYKLLYGDNCICTCPTRKEIFIKYEI